MKTKLITLKLEEYKLLKNALGKKLKSKCDFCHRRITSKNYGYLSFNVVSCNDLICLTRAIERVESRPEKPLSEYGELYPNCSEVVWRLKIPPTKSNVKQKIVASLMNEDDLEGRQETDTSSFPNGCMETMVDILKRAKDQGAVPEEVELELLDNIGGGGNPYFIEECFKTAKQCAEGKITEKQAEKKEEKLWESDDPRE